jgi:hypothetical protein
MSEKSSRVPRRDSIDVSSLSLGILVLSVVFLYVAYKYTPVGWLYYTLRSNRFEGRVAALVPEFNRLNDAVMESLPVHPNATLMPDTQRRQMPWENRWPPGGPPGLVSLSTCFKTNAPMSQIYVFYQDELESKGWALEKKNVDKHGYPLKQLFSKDQACIYMRSVCNTECEYDQKAIYEIVVYHDLNALLRFPNIPQIVYWMGGGNHCP